MNRILDAAPLIRTMIVVFGTIWLGHLLFLVW